MRKVALVFVLAVFVPSLVLAWLAVRTLSDQQLILERQQSLLYQGVTDSFARQVGALLEQRQHAFALQAEELLANNRDGNIEITFDEQLRTNWPSARVGFVVTAGSLLTCPTPQSRAEARAFAGDNARF